MTTPSSKEVLRAYRNAAERIADPIERAEYLRNIQFIETALAPEEFLARADKIKREEPSPLKRFFAASTKPLPADSAVAHLPYIRRAVAFFLYSFLAFFGLSFVPLFNERTRFLFLSAMLVSFGLGLFIASCYLFVYKAPIAKRYGNSHLWYRQNPAKYWAVLILSLAISMSLLTVGLNGFITNFVI